jgi:asparagine synthase (glutamine-hydrolysing)
MSMAASLEARVPFLDHELMEFAEAIPSRLKVRGRSGKWILRRALRPWIPAGVSARPKIAFETPISSWLRDARLDGLRERVLSEGSACSTLLRRREVMRLFDLHRTGRRDLHWQLFTLITLELWHDAVVRGVATGQSRPGEAGRPSTFA